MIRVVTWIDMDGPVLYEATRALDNPESWTLLRIDVGKQREPESVPGEVVLEHVGLEDVYRAIGFIDRAQRRRGG